MELLVRFFCSLAICNLIIMLYCNIDDVITRITKNSRMKRLANELEKINKCIMELNIEEEK